MSDDQPELTQKMKDSLRRGLLIMRTWAESPGGPGITQHVAEDMFEKDGFYAIGEIIGGLITINGIQLNDRCVHDMQAQLDYFDSIERRYLGT